MALRAVVLAAALSIFAHAVLADAMPTRAEAEAARQACDKGVAFDCVVTLALATAAENAGRTKPDVRLFLIYLIEHGDVERAEALSRDYSSEGQLLLELSYVIEPAPARLLLDRLVPPKTDAAQRFSKRLDLSMAYLATGELATAVERLREAESLTGQRAAKADEMIDWLVEHKDYDAALELFQLVKGMTKDANTNSWRLGRIAFALLLDGQVEAADETIRAVAGGTSTCDILVPYAVQEASADRPQAAARLSDLAEQVTTAPVKDGGVPCLIQIFDVLRSIDATAEAGRIASPVADWLSAGTTDVQTYALWSRLVTALRADDQTEEAARLVENRLHPPTGPLDSADQYVISEADFLRHLQAGETAAADTAFEALTDSPHVIRGGTAKILLAEGEDEKALQLLIGRPADLNAVLDATLDDHRSRAVLASVVARNPSFYDQVIARSKAPDERRYITVLVAQRLIELGDRAMARKLMFADEVWSRRGESDGDAGLSYRLWLAHEHDELGFDAEAQALRQEAYDIANGISDSAERLDGLFTLMSYLP